MAIKLEKKQIPTINPVPDRAVKLLAHSIFENLRNEGYHPKDIIGVSSQLISLVTTALEDLPDSSRCSSNSK